jgi:hypothetical protein
VASGGYGASGTVHRRNRETQVSTCPNSLKILDHVLQITFLHTVGEFSLSSVSFLNSVG